MKRTPITTDQIMEIIAGLALVSSREAGYALLPLDVLTAADLRRIARADRVPFYSTDTKDQVAARIVNLRVGRRIDDLAISRHCR